MLIYHHLGLMAYSFLALVGVLAGIVDTIAGGGGLITVPAMLSVGALPVNALGTTRFCSAIGELTAIVRFKKAAGIDFRKIRLGIVFTAIGALAGTTMLQQVHSAHMQKIIPFLLLAVLLWQHIITL